MKDDGKLTRIFGRSIDNKLDRGSLVQSKFSRVDINSIKSSINLNKNNPQNVLSCFKILLL